jgi:DNA replication protein DnaC
LSQALNISLTKTKNQRSDQSDRCPLARWLRYDVIVLDEVGYVPLADIGAEFLFQVIAERAERAMLIVTTNLPFSEWTQVFPNPRLCKALLDRITDRAHIIETGAESYRFRRTLETPPLPVRLPNMPLRVRKHSFDDTA